MKNRLPLCFHALGDLNRLAVVERLLEGPASVSDLAEPHSIVLSAFTKHLAVLERFGLIRSEKRGRVRVCAIDPATLGTVEGWFRDHRSLWEGRLDRPADHLASDKERRS